MGKYLDLDDVAYGHPVAMAELEQMRRALRIICTWASVGKEGEKEWEDVRMMALKGLYGDASCPAKKN